MKNTIVPYNAPDKIQLDKSGTIGFEFNLSDKPQNQIDVFVKTDVGINKPTSKEPSPPADLRLVKRHHWLVERNDDGISSGLVILQWSPRAKRWYKSGDIEKGFPVCTENWLYHEQVAEPQHVFNHLKAT